MFYVKWIQDPHQSFLQNPVFSVRELVSISGIPSNEAALSVYLSVFLSVCRRTHMSDGLNFGLLTHV